MKRNSENMVDADFQIKVFAFIILIGVIVAHFVKIGILK